MKEILIKATAASTAIHKFPEVVTGETYVGDTSGRPLPLTTTPDCVFTAVRLITSLYVVTLSLNTIMALKSSGTTCSV